jgi:virulence-associated protein VagC
MATKKTRLIMNANSLVIRPKKLSWAPLMDSLKKFTEDFMTHGRRQPAIQTR